MKVLNTLITVKRSRFLEMLIDYLLDAGHFVHERDLDTANHETGIFDFILDFDKVIPSSPIPQFIFNVYSQQKDTAFVRIGLIKDQQHLLLSQGKCSLNLQINLLAHLERFFVEVKELFIDAIVNFLRLEETELMLIPYQDDLISTIAFNDILLMDQQLITLFKYYELMSRSETKFKFPFFPAGHDKMYIELNLIQYKPTKKQVEFFVLYLLTLYNTRMDALYSYDLECNHQIITKYIQLSTCALYSQLCALIDAAPYTILTHSLYKYHGFLHHKAALLLSYDDLGLNKDTYQISVFFDEIKSRLGIFYPRELYFFSNISNLADDFFKKISLFQHGTLTFDDFLCQDDNFNFQQLVEWKQTTNECSDDKTIHQLIEEQVRKTPSNIAITFDNQKMTYEELNQEANQLACFIQKQTSRRHIAIYIDRGLEMVVSILGCLKAGCTFVPIDSNYPKEQVDYILQDTQVGLVLDNRLKDKPYRHEPKENLASISGPHDLAYIIYTSGTTGKPKGVMIEHASVMNVCENYIVRLNIDASSQVSQFLSIGFDAAYAEVFPALFCGACLHIIPEEIKHSPCYGKYLFKKQISVLTIPSDLLSAQVLEDLVHVRSIHTGGKSTNAALFEKWSKGRILINAYGPTEASIATTMFNYQVGSSGAVIGRPLNNIHVYVLDKKRRVLPIGVIGELYIGGAGLARGYLNHPDLTEERFISNSFATEADKSMGYMRLYKTGDLVRWLPDSNLEYIGRNDHQVKIRGYRIELGEIEHTLSMHPDITQSVVIVHDSMLIAYYIGKYQDNLRDYLIHKLPEYMVPNRFIHMASFPLTVNSKLDTRALPLPDSIIGENTYIAPRDELELLICDLWQDAFKVQKVSIKDDFFSLGGNSILAIQVAHQIGHTLTCHILVTDIFKHRTIAKLGSFLRGGMALEFIRPIKNNKPSALSFAQERLWFIEQYEGGTDAHHIFMRLPLRDDLIASLQRVIQRHSVLRTRIFVDDSGHCLQEVHCELLPIEDNINPDEFIHRVFDLTQGHPLRAGIHHDDLLIVFHHIAFDEWSRFVFQKELLCSALPPLNIQYSDFAVWQRSQLNTMKMTELAQYWKNKLQNYETLCFPTDYPRPVRFNYQGEAFAFTLTENLSNELRLFAKTERVSLYTVLLTGFAILLSKYTGQIDVVIGMPVINRQHPELSKLIGLFVNNIVLRLQLDLAKSATQCVDDVKKIVLEAQIHQDFPFEQLIKVLNLERDASKHPVFQIMLQMLMPGTENIDPLKETMNLFEHRTNMDMNVFMEDSQLCIRGVIVFAKSLFSRLMIERFAMQYQRVLEQMLINVDLPAAKYALLSPEEHQAIVYDWNNTEKDYPKDKTIHQLFEAQVKKTPNNIAVVFEDQQLTYQALNERSNQLARYIRKHYGNQIKPDTLIALCLDRSLEMVIAILGVLKAGGAYVPIDPNYPQARIRYILEDSAPALVVTQINLLVYLQDAIQSEVLLLDSAIYEQEPVDGVLCDVAPASLAYVIYTSGTTGAPKGVMVEHRCAANYVTNASAHIAADIQRFDFSTNLGFDLTITTTLVPLLLGRTIFVYGDKLENAENYIRHLKANKIDFIKLTPSYLSQALLLAPDIQIKQCFLGGEALLAHQLNIIQRHVEVVHDEYGPTETTVGMSLMEKSGDFNACIGKPYHNYSAYVLDQNLTPLPIGAIGELHIGGAGLARGYLNQPELTAERFIENPFATEADKAQGYTRLYKTGDLVRWLADGNLEYIGRNDFQVKIRGHRIELSEIERALSTHPDIKQCVVVRYEGRLIAYHVSQASVTDTTLSTHLSEQLPEYMIPSSFIYMESLPLTINGKLDRAALPKPDFAQNQHQYIAPRDERESMLCQIWQEVLNVPCVGIEDDFFRLGGDSIVSIRLVGKMKKHDFPVSVNDLFMHKTITNLLLHCGRFHEEKKMYQPFSLVLSETVTQITHKWQKKFGLIEDIFPVSYLQIGMFVDVFKQPELGLYVDASFFRIKKSYNEALLLLILGQLIEKHPLLRTSFVEHDKYGYLSIQWDTCSLDDHYQRIEKPFNEDDFLISQNRNLFQLDKPGLFNIIVYLESDGFVFAISLHHAITDGWSIASFLTECMEAYLTQSSITQERLPSYAQFVSNEIGVLAQNSYEDFWKKYVGEPVYLQKNLMFNKDCVSKSPHTLCFQEIRVEQSYALIELSKKLAISPDIIFLSIYLLVLSRFYAESEIIMGLSVNNRIEEEGGDKVFGLHLNIIPFKIKITPNDYSNLETFVLHVFSEKKKIEQYKAYPYGKIKSFFPQSDQNMYTCSFNYVHFHIAESIIQNDEIQRGGGIDFTSIPLTFHVQRFKNTFFIALNGHSDYIDMETAERFLVYATYYLNHLLKSDYKENAYLIPSDYQAVIYDWNNTEKDYLKGKTIHELFEAQVKCRPNNIAIVFGGQQLTYAELNQQANQLARQIRKHYPSQFKPDTLIAICMERGLEMVIAILGVLKAGAAYVPIDPNYPQERISYILKDSASSLLLTQICLLACLKEGVQSDILIFNRAVYEQESSSNLSRISGPNDLAYVIYTSGSSGIPKGVMVEHDGVVNYLAAQKEYLKLEPTQKFYFMHSFAFDTSLSSIFGALSNGCVLVIPEESEKFNVNHYKYYNIDVAYIPPALLNTLTADDIAPLKAIIVSGEIFNPSDISIFSPGVQIINEYGPTEGVICSSYCFLNINDDSPAIIGRPINNKKIYVLDDMLRPLPMGVIGELYIGGKGLARGYLNQPELTEERFIPNPFVTEADQTKGYTRLYKTGDLAQWLPNGTLKYIGRNDFQVKVRGYRIELSEIEHVLSTHPDIKQCVVVSHEGRLIAYYVSPLPVVSTNISKHVRQQLPEYMLPSAFIQMNSLPLTINSKIDRSALPKPNFVQNTHQYIAPRNEIEFVVCEIWQEILNISQISIDDDFFDLGGHSVLAIQITHRMSCVLDLNLLMTDVLKYRTVRKVCEILKNVDALEKIQPIGVS